jgi:hypothetical protein
MASARQLQELFEHVSKFVVEGRSDRESHVFSLAAPGSFVLREEVVRLSPGEPGGEDAR